jgi:DNA gyrase subunit A
VQGIRIAGRNTRGVRLLRVAEGERVVSVAHLGEQDIAEAAEAAEEGAPNAPQADAATTDTPGGDGDAPDPETDS